MPNWGDARKDLPTFTIGDLKRLIANLDDAIPVYIEGGGGDWAARATKLDFEMGHPAYSAPEIEAFVIYGPPP